MDPVDFPLNIDTVQYLVPFSDGETPSDTMESEGC
jgi:hypothetical protein